MQVKLKGTIHSIGAIQEIPTKTGDIFTKRTVIIEEIADKYPQHFSIDFIKDDVNLLNTYMHGEQIEINCNIRGNIFNGKCFNSFQAWKIENAKVNQSTQTSQQIEPMPEPTDDLPF